MLGLREVHDAGSRPAYPPEFRQKKVELVRTGRSPEQLAKKFDSTAQTIRNWVAQAEAKGGKHRPEALTSSEREILAKATTWFARKAESTPKKSSGS